MKSNNEELNIQTDLSDYLDNNHDCLTDAFERLLWCIKIVLLSLWKVLLYTKEELCCTRHETIRNKNILSMNNSAYRKLPRHRSRLTKNKSSSKLNILSDKARVTIRSVSNQNLNHVSSTPSNTLGISNSHITVTPINSSHCRNRKLTENGDLREQLADALCRRPYEPLIFINRGGMCCGHCRPLIFPNVPFHHSCHNFPLINPQSTLNQDKEQSSQMGDMSATQSIDTMSNNEQNHSILSFPEHDTPLSQKSEKLLDDDTQLRLNAQIIVDDSIQDAHEIYRKIQMNTNQEELPDVNIFYQELCNKLNLSDSNQITEIMQLLASNAPHVLKEQPPTNTSNINKDENNLCSQLLLHPPFKPKRLINLCPDGSIQVLSAIDHDNSNENLQQYQLNYSNSAVLDDTPVSIVNIDLDLNDEDDENSLPEIFFKRIITPVNHTRRR